MTGKSVQEAHRRLAELADAALEFHREAQRVQRAAGDTPTGLALMQAATAYGEAVEDALRAAADQGWEVGKEAAAEEREPPEWRLDMD